MHMPAFTLACAGVLGLIFAVLSVRIVLKRGKHNVMLGEGEGSPLLVAIRSQANFAEYVPLCLLLMAGLEMQTGATLLVKILGAALVLSRVSHPFGMAIPGVNPFRAAGFVGTILVLLVGSVAVLVRVF